MCHRMNDAIQLVTTQSSWGAASLYHRLLLLLVRVYEWTNETEKTRTGFNFSLYFYLSSTSYLFMPWASEQPDYSNIPSLSILFAFYDWTLYTRIFVFLTVNAYLYLWLRQCGCGRQATSTTRKRTGWRIRKSKGDIYEWWIDLAVPLARATNIAPFEIPEPWI